MAKDTFGEKVLEARKIRGWSQKHLADLLGVTNTYISKIENDCIDYPPSEMFLQKLAFHLGLSESKIKRISGWISKKDEKIFGQLTIEYPEFLPLLRKIRKDTAFADKIFNLLEDAND